MSPALLILVAALIAANAFFVVAEYALVRSRRSRLEHARDEGVRGAALALRQLDDMNAYISTCQVGITMTSIGIGALGEPTVSHLLKGPLGGPLSHGLAVAISAAIAYLLITSAHITLGEIVPKLYTIEHAERLSRRVARPLEFSRLVFSPFSTVLVAISNRILRLLGVRPETLAEQEGGSAEELKIIIAQSLQGGHIDPGEAGMLSGVFELHEQEARQVMTPIPAVVTVDTSESVEVALRRCVETGHTRLLVTEDENPDRVRGIVHVNSLARALLSHGREAPLEPLVKDAPIVPETKPLDDLLAELQRQRLTMAVVVDEYGRVVGILTVEDILEEVVGEIEDETDPAGGAIRRLPNGDWFVRGHVAVTDLKDYGLELPVDSDAYNSIGGYVFNQLGRLPRRGDTISANGYSIRVESVRENRIEAVRIRERRRAIAS
ncbi:MAG: hemolysin family protein [Actinomycetota bacterium]|nr:hemolysin family protein [Actinomycetota bacterium]